MFSCSVMKYLLFGITSASKRRQIEIAMYTDMLKETIKFKYFGKANYFGFRGKYSF